MIKFSAIGAFSMAFTIILGALAAHMLEKILDPDRMAILQTGIKYQMIHSIALVVLPLLFYKLDINMTRSIWYLQIAGIILFSFILYTLALKDVIGIPNARWLGRVAPLGGLSFIASWIILGINLLKFK